LFDIKASIISTDSQYCSIKIDFADDKITQEFYQYWYALKGEEVSESVVNPHTHINLTDIPLTEASVYSLAECSPYVEYLSGLALEKLCLSDYSTLLAHCPSLRQLSSDESLQNERIVDLSFRTALPPSIKLIDDEKSGLINKLFMLLIRLRALLGYGINHLLIKNKSIHLMMEGSLPLQSVTQEIY